MGQERKLKTCYQDSYHWSFIPSRTSERQCRMHLRVSLLKGWRGWGFYSATCHLSLLEGCFQGHFLSSTPAFIVHGPGMLPQAASRRALRQRGAGFLQQAALECRGECQCVASETQRAHPSGHIWSCHWFFKVVAGHDFKKKKKMEGGSLKQAYWARLQSLWLQLVWHLWPPSSSTPSLTPANTSVGWRWFLGRVALIPKGSEPLLTMPLLGLCYC